LPGTKWLAQPYELPLRAVVAFFFKVRPKIEKNGQLNLFTPNKYFIVMVKI